MPDNNTVFLNVDLDVQIATGLEVLLAELGRDVAVLHQDSTTATIELNREVSDPQDALIGLAILIEALSPDARRIWEEAEKRSMSIGIQAGARPHSLDFVIPPDCIARLERIGVEIVFTVYASAPLSIQ